VKDFAWAVGTLLGSCPEAEVAGRVAQAMKPLLAETDLLSLALREEGTESYREHILYADPAQRFTLLALIWRPGQGTPIHGHTAWGAVGIYEGTPRVETFTCREGPHGRHEARPLKDFTCAPGDLAIVQPGLEDVHRISNATSSTVITLHAYGRDLVEDPDAINLHLAL